MVRSKFTIPTVASVTITAEGNPHGIDADDTCDTVLPRVRNIPFVGPPASPVLMTALLRPKFGTELMDTQPAKAGRIVFNFLLGLLVSSTAGLLIRGLAELAN